MKYYLAPMEGITGHIYRSVYGDMFHNMDKYFTPFISPNMHGKFSSREKKEIAPENNVGLYVVPQILTNNADYFIKTAQSLLNLGYDEVNLNLGCPSGTVVSKHKGAGFLGVPDELHAFLDNIFNELDMKISIKTRLGMEQASEFPALLKMFNEYPLEELIIHPRVRSEFYKNKPDMEAFKAAVAASTNPICYNGDLFTKEDYENFCNACPTVERIMLGRGVLRYPGYVDELKTSVLADKQVIRSFHDRVYHDYQGELSGERDTLFKMKEFWFYYSKMFTGADKNLKKIHKTGKLRDYDVAVNEIFATCEIVR